MFQSITLQTNKLKHLRRFYQNIMAFDITDTREDRFTVKIGTSDLTFVQSEQAAFYHFAINIPGNQFTIIKEWLSLQYTLSQHYAVDEVYYPNFDADAMYVEDPAGNLIELIGRRNLDFLGNFTKEAFYNMSEIALVTPHVIDVGEQLQDIDLTLQQGIVADPAQENYLGQDDTFIVLIETGKAIDFLAAKMETHPVDITLDNGKQLQLNQQGKLTIHTPKPEKSNT